MYKGVVKRNTGLFPTSDPKKMMRDYYEAQVFWNSEYVAKTGVWCEIDNKRGKASCQRSADALARRYQYHYDKTGKRFELEQREKDQKERDRKKAERQRIARIKDHGVELLDSLEEIVADIRFFGLEKEAEGITEKLARAEAIIAKAREVKNG